MRADCLGGTGWIPCPPLRYLSGGRNPGTPTSSGGRRGVARRDGRGTSVWQAPPQFRFPPPPARSGWKRNRKGGRRPRSPGWGTAGGGRRRAPAPAPRLRGAALRPATRGPGPASSAVPHAAWLTGDAGSKASKPLHAVAVLPHRRCPAPAVSRFWYGCFKADTATTYYSSSIWTAESGDAPSSSQINPNMEFFQ